MHLVHRPRGRRSFVPSDRRGCLHQAPRPVTPTPSRHTLLPRGKGNARGYLASRVVGPLSAGTFRRPDHLDAHHATVPASNRHVPRCARHRNPSLLPAKSFFFPGTGNHPPKLTWTSLMQQAPHPQLRFRILPPDPAHIPRPPLLRKQIHLPPNLSRKLHRSSVLSHRSSVPVLYPIPLPEASTRKHFPSPSLRSLRSFAAEPPFPSPSPIFCVNKWFPPDTFSL